ncbi:MAG: GrpB family protein [Acidimicrobiia bacterium]|nr:GrpB family protein [Acidimicrobiia bacterium]
MLIEIVGYNESWPEEFVLCAAPIRAALGNDATAIHHIGSTSVPGLAAKDLIDIQVTVASLGEPVIAPMVAAGFTFHDHLPVDHQPPGAAYPEVDLQKNTFTQREGDKRTNIHVRVEGAFNQRYAVLFRDYLRSHPRARDAYGELKRNLARLFPNNVVAYYDIKDPAIDMLMAGANIWAEATGWEVPPSDA